METIQYQGIECDTVNDAIQYANASGFGEAIRLNGATVVVPQADCDRLAAAGVEFAYLCDYERDDGSHTILTIPVN